MLASISMSLYASPAYLDLRGRPPSGDALAGHDVILFAASPGFALENDWLEKRLDGAKVVLRSDSVSSVYASAAAGMGIALLPRIVADSDPDLERIPTETPPETRQIWQGVHKDLARTPRVQAVAAFVAEVVGGEW
jgi:DNA-binding transcriptional LysR family regulator